MKISFDPKPFGAFIEYTLKHVIEDSNELLDRIRDAGLDPIYLIGTAFKMFLVQQFLWAFVNITCTSLVCWTAYLILSRSPHIIP